MITTPLGPATAASSSSMAAPRLRWRRWSPDIGISKGKSEFTKGGLVKSEIGVHKGGSKLGKLVDGNRKFTKGGLRSKGGFSNNNNNNNIKVAHNLLNPLH